MKVEDLVVDYNIEEDILVVEKSDIDNGVISGQLYLVPREEWFNEECFHLFETKLDGNRVSLYLACGGEYAIIHKQVPIENKDQYIAIDFAQ